MTETVVEKIESRQNHSKAWRLSDKEGGCFLDVTFNIDLEKTMKEQRNFSFSRFVSEQLNELSKMVPSLTSNYSLAIDRAAVGPAYLPLDNAKAKPLLTQLA